MIDGVRLAVGTLSVLPVSMPGKVDRVVAGRAMLFAPAVGLLLGGIAGAAVAGVDALRPDAPLLSAVVGVVILVVLSGALHLDGLADLADGLGSRRDRETMLQIMRQSDIGPFGVASITGVLLIDVAALTACVQAGVGWQAIIVAGMASRLTLPWSCRTSVPSARPDGLGAMVAGTVRTPTCLLVTLLTLAAATTLTWLTTPAHLTPPELNTPPTQRTLPDLTTSPDLITLVGTAVAVLLAVAVALLLIRRARTALGGITGDVLGATVELALPTTLLTLALSLHPL